MRGMERRGSGARRPPVRRPVALAATLAAALLPALAPTAPPAFGAFPYPSESKMYTDPGQVPNDLSGDRNDWKFAATRGEDADNGATANLAGELKGVRGARVADNNPGVGTAWQQITGRPDVTIAVLDSGIKWNDAGAMGDLKDKVRLNKGELPLPQSCSGYDCDGNGVFNVADYQGDPRINLSDPRRDGPAGVLTPQDLLIAFSDGTDADSNGFVDDIAGWDFLDDDNDAFDDVQYGHGTGEAKDSSAEADNGGQVGSCPNCMFIPLRVGDSFIADVNRFAAAVIYATDNGALVVQEALGTLNNSSFARHAVDYAYRHGVTVIASAADEAAQHNNWPSSLPHVILVNSITTLDAHPPGFNSYVAFNGCTNFNSKITLAIPSSSCSSNATGLGAGMAGLVYSAALTAKDKGALAPYPDRSTCELTTGERCVITPNEVRQIMASGTINNIPQSEDVNFASPNGEPEPSCATPAPGCTDPNGALWTQVKALRQPLQPDSFSYPARRGHDQFYGWGRANMDLATKALLSSPNSPDTPELPPEAEILSPEWYAQVAPSQQAVDVQGQVYARGSQYTCRLEVAPGQYPNNRRTIDSPPGDFKLKLAGAGWCDGQTTHTEDHKGSLGQIDLADLKSRFPPGTDFKGPEPPASLATGNGRPNPAPHSFTVRVIVETTRQGDNLKLTGEDRRAMYLHRDQDMLKGFPRFVSSEGPITGDGESSPAFADLDGDDRNELIYASTDGLVHALQRDGKEIPGWPVRGDQPGFVSSHSSARAYSSGEVPTDFGGGMLASVAVGDANHDGIPEVYAADLEGRVYGWTAEGQRIFTEETNPAYSGAPLPNQPFVENRRGNTNRTQHGFIGSPVLADLDGDGKQELIAAAMDRHVYAWEANDTNPGSPGGAAQVQGFPVLVVDPGKVQSIDPQTHRIDFKSGVGATLDQGGIIDTPAVADIAGDEDPEIIVGTNEEYEEPLNAGNLTTTSFAALTQLPGPLQLDAANSRLYAIKPESDDDGNPDPGGSFVAGWPFAVGIATSELLPVVGEGITGYPVVSELTCPSGGSGPKIGVLANNGPAYVLNDDATSCYGDDPTSGRPNALESDFSASTTQYDHPLLPAVGHPAFGALGGPSPAFLSPAAGLGRALDVALTEYQQGQDFVAAWDSNSGQFRPGFPAALNDLQFVTGPSIADIDGLPGEEVVEGTASMDLAALDAAGLPANPRWPKLSSDWTVANPLIGSFGTLDTDGDARKVVVGMTRSGYINAYATDAPACSPGSWPRFHHDNANSGDFGRDAVLPGKPRGIEVKKRGSVVDFKAPGDDLLCGTADRYEIATSNRRITEENFAQAEPLGGAPDPTEPGTTQTYAPPAGARRFVAIRAVDDQDNVGRVVSVALRGQGRGGQKPRSSGPSE